MLLLATRITRLDGSTHCDAGFCLSRLRCADTPRRGQVSIRTRQTNLRSVTGPAPSHPHSPANASSLREIGIRIALGARQSDVRRTVTGRVFRLTCFGAVPGLALSAATTRILVSMLYDVSALDPDVFVAGILIVTLTALLGGWVPAWRASRLSPLDALRTDGAVTHERNSMTRMESY